MKHKTATLEGELLEAAVALAEGWAPHLEPLEHWLRREADGGYLGWAAGGPIIERERIGVLSGDAPFIKDWSASIKCRRDGYPVFLCASGPTPLVAAMRAFVASRFGDEVELPEAPR